MTQKQRGRKRKPHKQYQSSKKKPTPSTKTNGANRDDIHLYRRSLNSKDINKVLQAVSKLRILLSDEQKPPIDEVIKAGCVCRLIDILKSRGHTSLLFETAWVLTNICSGSHEHTMHVVDCGGIECILDLLKLDDTSVLEQAIWVLGNIAGDGAAARDICLQKGVLRELIELSNKHKEQLPLSFQRNFVWTISNLVRGKPQFIRRSSQRCEQWNTVYRVIPVILRHLRSNDVEVLTDTCWALSYLSDGCNEHIQSILDCSKKENINVSKYLVGFLDRKEMNVLVPALRTCGNIVSGSDEQTQSIMDCGLLEKLKSLLRHPNHSVKKEAIWTVSNITAGNPQQIQLVIDNELFLPLIEILNDHTADADLVKECIWAISNATTGGTESQLTYLAKNATCGLARVMGYFPKDKKLRIVLLEGVENLLLHGNNNCLFPRKKNHEKLKRKKIKHAKKLFNKNMSKIKLDDKYDKRILPPKDEIEEIICDEDTKSKLMNNNINNIDNKNNNVLACKPIRGIKQRNEHGSKIRAHSSSPDMFGIKETSSIEAINNHSTSIPNNISQNCFSNSDPLEDDFEGDDSDGNFSTPTNNCKVTIPTQHICSEPFMQQNKNWVAVGTDGEILTNREYDNRNEGFNDKHKYSRTCVINSRNKTQRESSSNIYRSNNNNNSCSEYDSQSNANDITENEVNSDDDEDTKRCSEDPTTTYANSETDDNKNDYYSYDGEDDEDDNDDDDNSSEEEEEEEEDNNSNNNNNNNEEESKCNIKVINHKRRYQIKREDSYEVSEIISNISNNGNSHKRQIESPEFYRKHYEIPELTHGKLYNHEFAHNYVIHQMVESQSDEHLAYWFFDPNADPEVSELAQVIYERYFHFAFQF